MSNSCTQLRLAIHNAKILIRRILIGSLYCLIGLALNGCEILGIDTPKTIAANKEAQGRAIGGACRHAGRAIEDCFTLNRKADKAAIYAGWRDMNDYMRENKIDPISPIIPVPSKDKKSATAQSQDSGQTAQTEQSSISAESDAKVKPEVLATSEQNKVRANP